jgi:hypothetical protein
LQGFANHKAWMNKSSGMTQDSEKENLKTLELIERREFWYGHGLSDDYSLGMANAKASFNKRSCYELLESFKGSLKHHYIDRITGVELGHRVLDKNKKMLKTHTNTKWGRVGKVIVPLAWEVTEKGSDLKRKVRVQKLSYNMKLDKLIFEYQPGVHF